MPVIQAKSAGFCYGVRRAVELAEKTARENGGCSWNGWGPGKQIRRTRCAPETR